MPYMRMEQPIALDTLGNAVGEKAKSQNNKISHIAWHPAFVEAIQLELEVYKNFLEFRTEYQLTTEPLRIDCIIIKKASDIEIEKNIAVIFRDVNLLEYKSPDDYVSVTDFYKVYGYACLFSSMENVPITKITISFIESRYPKGLLEHLKNIRGYKVEKTSPGIYTVNGDILPIQVIDSRQLSADENLWLKYLSNRLDPFAVIKISKEARRLGKVSRIQAYIDAITKANIMVIKEAITMSDETLTLDQVFIETGLAARWEERKALDIAQNMINLGLPIETVVSATKLDLEKVKSLYIKN